LKIAQSHSLEKQVASPGVVPAPRVIRKYFLEEKNEQKDLVHDQSFIDRYHAAGGLRPTRGHPAATGRDTAAGCH
jgi:hypothetical protein